MDLAEFLLARVAEDEQQTVRSWPFSNAKISADCDAKRRIVTEVHHRAGEGPRSEWLSDWQKDACEGCGWGGPTDDYHVEHINDCPTLRLLASPYADHPDYDPAWKPVS